MSELAGGFFLVASTSHMDASVPLAGAPNLLCMLLTVGTDLDVKASE